VRYDPYGAVTRLDAKGDTGGWLENPYVFHGGVQDRATGNIKFGQRFYNPTTGTWTQQDLINAPLDPHNANRYEYAADNPINYTDCTGRALTYCGQAAIWYYAGIGIPMAAFDPFAAAAIGIYWAYGADTVCSASPASVEYDLRFYGGIA
jgi:RHS repeat-associated protein